MLQQVSYQTQWNGCRRGLCMNEYYVYIVKCSDESFYTGVTSDVARRLAEHNEGIDPYSYTHSRRPVELFYLATFTDPNQAIAFEKQLKGWSRAKKEALGRSDWDSIKAEASCRNDSHYSRLELGDFPDGPLADLS